MKHLRNLALLALVIALALACCGCQNPFVSNTNQNPDYKDIPKGSVLFFHDEDEYTMAEDDLLDYTSEYTQYNSTYFKSLLTGEDLVIYQAYLYAMEHGYTNFELYVASKDRDFSHIRQYLSLDSPFLEQNVHSGSETTMLWSSAGMGERVRFTISHFTDAIWKTKMDALDACKEIVEQMPAFDTQEEQMAYLLEYVCQHVTYIHYGESTHHTYLYDAVIDGASNCDGYSNMLFLLYRLIDVDACEAMGNDALDDSGSVGHTWVVAKLDGAYYNFDATFADNEKSVSMVYFSFSDKWVDSKYISCDDVRIHCEDESLDFNFADYVTESLTADATRDFAKITEKKASDGVYETTMVIQEVVDQNQFDGFLEDLLDHTDNLSKVSATYIVYSSFTIVNITAESR